ncbi:hypothetical protein MTP99_014646 [Tenebrio molitor]|uniref:Trissin n=1 Tax=Tenebrio molitor TaxID=7067 RepID=A0A977SQ90_TENMO|nr:hypothetical protein MTP99_014646 [Tenebrio molitor]UXO98134.1 trissin [Tenebrio molitor]CAH1373219.1 unnamed protein product [Tenebrio molitor]
MNKNLVVVLIVIAGVVWGEVQSCTSCGSECQSACGTRHFRTCCFNYLKKRNSDSLAMDPSLRLELWLAKSRNPYFQQQRNFLDSSLEMPETVNHDHDITQ